MKRVTISVTFDCDDKTAEEVGELSLSRIPSAYAMQHFASRSLNGSLFTSIETRELFHVQVPAKEVEMGFIKSTHITDGCLSFAGNKNYYTRGEAMKKARLFNGQIIKAE
jgi:hypothetical protein